MVLKQDRNNEEKNMLVISTFRPIDPLLFDKGHRCCWLRIWIPFYDFVMGIVVHNLPDD